MGWLDIQHAETHGRARIPDTADVVALHEAKGWVILGPSPDPDALTPELPAELQPEETTVEAVEPAGKKKEVSKNG